MSLTWFGDLGFEKFQNRHVANSAKRSQKNGLEGDSSQNGFYVAFEFEVDCPNGIPNETK